ncbi:MAG: helix-turn-helix transcriptional regulator [Ruminococcaceae bacterium]|nr:helix-turn-helix transcriptional regulator [Oscillospiraceae bacterium]
MNLGERIYLLRSRKGFSQGELADSLNVSRQAVSKWENNSAVPDLERIVKMSEIFGISIDELIKGETPEGSSREALKSEPPQVLRNPPMPARKIAGLMLFGMAFITSLVLFAIGGFQGLLFGIPFLVFGLISFFCEKYTLLKCLWALYLMLTLFLRMAMGISVSRLRYIFSSDAFITEKTIIALCMAAFIVFLIFFTVKKLKEEPVKNLSSAKKKLIIITAALICVSALYICFSAVFVPRIVDKLSSEGAHYIVYNIVYYMGLLEELFAVSSLTAVLSLALRIRKKTNNQ